MKTYIETILEDLDLIDGVTTDYSDDTVEEKAYVALARAVKLISELKGVINSKDITNLLNFTKCCTAYRDESGKCKGYQVSRHDENIADRCKECEEFEGRC